jgi:hypothetical protein
VYPDYNWLPWKFAKSPNKLWDDITNVKKFIEWAGTQLGIKELNDWKRVHTKVYFCVLFLKKQDIVELGGNYLLFKKYHCSLPQILSIVYPDHDWDFSSKAMSFANKKSQTALKSMLNLMFPKEGYVTSKSVFIL